MYQKFEFSPLLLLCPFWGETGILGLVKAKKGQ